MSAHTGRLVLSPQDPFLLPDRTLLTASLTEARFLGSPLVGCDAAFAVGERFLQLVTFAGCSVRIELSPDADAPFCYIRFTGPFERPTFLSGRNTRPPRCPHCRTPWRDWKHALLDQKIAGATQIPCPACGQASPPWAYDWKQKAGFGRQFVQVEEVFPGEAAPTPGLMDLLEGSSGYEWQHFYIQDA